MKKYDLDRLRNEKLAKNILLCSAAFLTVIIIALIIFMGQQGLQTFLEVSPFEFFFTSKWNPDNGQYGALSFIFGSLLVTFLSILVGGPIGIMGAVFMAKLAPKWMCEIMKPAVNLYMAIPSVVYGFIGLTVVVPAVREYFGVPVGFGIFTASFILAIMILPTVISISTDALLAVPKILEEGSVALGATYWQTIWHIVLRLADSLFSPTSTLPSEIVVEMGNTPFGSTWGNALFLMALVLLLISLIMILLVRKISAKKAVEA